MLYRSVRSQRNISTLKMLFSTENSAGSVFKVEIEFQESVFLTGSMALVVIISFPVLLVIHPTPHSLDPAEVEV